MNMSSLHSWNTLGLSQVIGKKAILPKRKKQFNIGFLLDKLTFKTFLFYFLNIYIYSTINIWCPYI